MNIAHILRQQAATRPDQPAIIDTSWGRPRVTTFAQLETAAARGAALLAQNGLGQGSRVLVFYPMSAELYAALIALFRLGSVTMFLDPSAGRAHIEQCCALCPPNGLVASPKAHLLRLLSPALRRIPSKFVIGMALPGAVRWARADRLAPLPSIHAADAHTPALLTFTSGSTGQPKAAVRTHGFLLAQHRVLEQSLGLRPGTVDLTTLPIVLLANLASGVTSVIPNADLRYPGAVKPGPLFQQIKTYGVETSAGSPAFFECLARHGLATGENLPGLRRLFLGGAPVFPRLLDQLATVAANAELVSLYGSTEAEPIAHVRRSELRPDDLIAMSAGRGLLAGRPGEAIELRIMRDQWGRPIGPFTAAEFAAQCQPAGAPGEIVVHGDHVLTGYWQGQGDAETKFRVDGAVWHRTGDAGHLDEVGRLWLLGRCAARIEDRHGVLYPFSAECAAYAFPAVRRAALVGHAGRRILAVEFFPGESADAGMMKAALGWARLDEVRFFRALPVDARHNAKIDYPRLQRLLALDH